MRSCVLTAVKVSFSIHCAVVEEAQARHDAKVSDTPSLLCFTTRARPTQIKRLHVHSAWNLGPTVRLEGRCRPSEAAGLSHTGPESVLLSILPPMWGKTSVILNYSAILISVQTSASQIIQVSPLTTKTE